MADITLPDTLRLLQGTTELAKLGPNTNKVNAVIGGQLVCRDANGAADVIVTGGTEGEGGQPDGGSLYLRHGAVQLADRTGKQRALLIAADDLEREQGGILVLRAAGDTATGPVGTTGAIVLNAARRSLVIQSKEGMPRVELGTGGNLALGGGGTNGELVLRNVWGKTVGQLGGEQGNFRLGGEGHDADFLLLDTAGQTRVHLDAGRGGSAAAAARVYVDGKNGNATLGGNQVNGELFLKDTDGKIRIHADGAGHIKLLTAGGDVKVHIDGVAGDIVLPNSDCAEDFDLAAAEACEPGTVMVIDEQGGLRACDVAYDKKVAGVLSGAGDLKPGIILGRSRPSPGRRPLALVGKVFCRVDAAYAPIEVGDLLTTSATPGHAMKACDPAKAFGAVIGKALRSWRDGRGLIPILVALQ